MAASLLALRDWSRHVVVEGGACSLIHVRVGPEPLQSCPSLGCVGCSSSAGAESVCFPSAITSSGQFPQLRDEVTCL